MFIVTVICKRAAAAAGPTQIAAPPRVSSCPRARPFPRLSERSPVRSMGLTLLGICFGWAWAGRSQKHTPCKKILNVFTFYLEVHGA